MALAALVWIPSASALSIRAIAPADGTHVTLTDHVVFTWTGDAKGCLDAGPPLGQDAAVYVVDDHGARWGGGYLNGGKTLFAIPLAYHGIFRWRLHAECNTKNGGDLQANSGFRTLYIDQPGTKPKECTATVGELTHNATANGRPLHPGDSVSAGSYLVTGVEGALSLDLPGGGHLILGSGSTSEWSSPCKPSDGGDTITLKIGMIRRVEVPAVTVKVGKAVRVKTKNAFLRVRLLGVRRAQSAAAGTSQEAAFAVSYDPKLRTTREHTFAEAVVVRNNAGKEVTVPAGFCSSVVGGSAPTTPRRC